jgi:four helix bundle protein
MHRLSWSGFEMRLFWSAIDLAHPLQCADDMNQKAEELQARTRAFASSVIRFCERLRLTDVTRQIAQQLADSAGSTDSNYRAACRGRSVKEFIAKLGVAAEEADESKGWLQLLVQSGIASGEPAVSLITEADELTRIFVASRKTAEKRRAEREALKKVANRKTPIDSP